jgi:hypothetical protein
VTPYPKEIEWWFPLFDIFSATIASGVMTREYPKESEEESMREITSWHVGVAAEAIAAALFARCGIDVSVQYGADQPLYDLIVSKGSKMLRVSVKGSQTGKWGICQGKITKGQADYHEAIEKWLGRHTFGTVLCFVQFKDVGMLELPRVYLATPQEVADRLKATAGRRGSPVLYEKHTWRPGSYAAGVTDMIPSEWRFSRERIDELFKIIGSGVGL